MKVNEIKSVQSKLNELDQFSPLFPDVANEDMYTNVVGEVLTTQFNGNDLKSLVIKAEDDPKVSTQIPLVRGAETKTIWNVGLFTALRDYESQRGNKFVAGKTQRVFAY